MAGLVPDLHEEVLAEAAVLALVARDPERGLGLVGQRAVVNRVGGLWKKRNIILFSYIIHIISEEKIPFTPIPDNQGSQ